MNARTARRFVPYYRVSTARQGQSGLGLEAQQKAVRDFLNGGAWEIVAEFVEVESGKRADRPELARALDACRKHKAKLVIAKLDRLAEAIAKLPPDQLVRFRRWFTTFEAARADHAKELDSTATKLGRLAGRVFTELKKRGTES
jgi:hypothetical protein